MAIDPKVHEAVEAAVKSCDQPPKVATRILKWLEALAEGTANIDKEDDVRVYLENILDAIEADEYESDDEGSE